MFFLVAKLCPTFCDTMEYNSLDSTVHEILQARTLEWVVIHFSRGSSWPRDWTQVSCIAGRFFTIWATRDQIMTNYFTAALLKVTNIHQYVTF